jgi:hypothetical protein
VRQRTLQARLDIELSGLVFVKKRPRLLGHGVDCAGFGFFFTNVQAKNDLSQVIIISFVVLSFT